MIRSTLFAAAMMLPLIAAAQDRTGSIPAREPRRIVTEQQVRDHLAGAGYTAIGTLDRDADGIWRTTAMKGGNMMAVGVGQDGTIEDR
jgi:hypothetical protein